MNTLPVSYDEHRTSFWSSLYTFKEVLPGLLAMFFIAIFSNNLAGSPNPLTLENLFYYLDQVIGPVNGQPFFQIMNSNFVWNSFLLGFIISNVFGVHDSWKRGLSYIHKLMPLGIIMLAPHFVFSHATKLGWGVILFAMGVMFLSAVITILLGFVFKVDERHSSNIAGGLTTGDPHVCAILMPMLKAKGGQVMNATACVILFGAIASFFLPMLGKLLDMTPQAFGLASVLGIGNGAQALNAAFGYSHEAGRFAIYSDAVRHVIMPAGFLFVFLFMYIRKKLHNGPAPILATQGVNAIPPYVIVFVVLWVIAQVHLFKEPAHHAVFAMVQWDFSLAAAALGLSLPLREILQWGVRGFFLTVVSGLIRILLVCGGIILLDKYSLLPF